MAKRQVIKIDQDRCNGCGLCIPNCPEGALQIIDKKAQLVSELFCDGLGSCIGHCPLEAITIEEKEAEPYDERKVMANIVRQGKNVIKAHLEHLKAHNQSLYLKQATDFLKDTLVKELEEYFGNDTKRINHAKNVMHFAEELLKQEKVDWHIVIASSILHDVGIKVAEEKFHSSAGHYQEKEGPAIARDILLKVGFNKEDIEQICEIIAHHHSPGKVNTMDFKVLYDADRLVNLKDEVDITDKIKLRATINKVFLTRTARELAEKIYLTFPRADKGVKYEGHSSR